MESGDQLAVAARHGLEEVDGPVGGHGGFSRSPAAAFTAPASARCRRTRAALSLARDRSPWLEHGRVANRVAAATAAVGSGSILWSGAGMPCAATRALDSASDRVGTAGRVRGPAWSLVQRRRLRRHDAPMLVATPRIKRRPVVSPYFRSVNIASTFPASARRTARERCSRAVDHEDDRVSLQGPRRVRWRRRAARRRGSFATCPQEHVRLSASKGATYEGDARAGVRASCLSATSVLGFSLMWKFSLTSILAVRIGPRTRGRPRASPRSAAGTSEPVSLHPQLVGCEAAVLGLGPLRSPVRRG